MSTVFPSDKQYFYNSCIEIKNPFFLVVEDPSLNFCVEFFVNQLKKKGFSEKITNNAVRKSNEKATEFVFSIVPSNKESFQVKVEKNSDKTVVGFSGSSVSTCYYAIQSFLRETQISRIKLRTKLKAHSGKTKNPYRNLIISLSWMENLIEFPFFNLEKWKDFISLACELRFHRIDFMQWGCTIPDPPLQNTNVEDEWELWEKGKNKESAWPVPQAYRGLKYQEGGWKTRKLFQPWLFPIKGKYIKYADTFSVCYPPENKIPLSYWDKNKQKLIRRLWKPPFIQDKDLFKKIIDFIHRYGMHAGVFTSARVPCVNQEKDFIKYWQEVIRFFLEQGIDDFVFETEEGPLSFEHHKNCKSCQKRFGDIFTGYTLKVANQTNLLNDIINKFNRNSDIGWICHVPLNGGYGNPPERKEWLKNPENYVENLKAFKKSAPENLRMNYAPQPGEHGINHSFLPQIYLDIFGTENIRQTGYTHAWGPVRAFIGLEAYFINEATNLWDFDPANTKSLWKNWQNQNFSKSILHISSKIYGSTKVVKDLAIYSINNRRTILEIKSAVCPYVWDRSVFCIYEQVLKKMFDIARKQQKTSYLFYPRQYYLNLLRRLLAVEKRLQKVKINNSFLSCDWNFKEGFEERYSLVKAAKLAVEFLVKYDDILIEFSKTGKIKEKDLHNLLEIGISINNECVNGHKTSIWPGSSRLGGLYDYYAFVQIIKKFFTVDLTKKDSNIK